MPQWEGFRESKLRLDGGFCPLVFDRGWFSYTIASLYSQTVADITKVILSAPWPDLLWAHARPKPAGH